MPQGMQVFDSAGRVIMDVTTRISTILGSVPITQANGFVSDAGFAKGSPFWGVVVTGSQSSLAAKQPKIAYSVVSGVGRLTWTWPTSGLSTNIACTLIYGVY